MSYEFVFENSGGILIFKKYKLGNPVIGALSLSVTYQKL